MDEEIENNEEIENQEQLEDSEANDTQVTEDSELIDSALESTDEQEVDPKDAVIGNFRRRLRDSEQEVARLSGLVEGMKSTKTPDDKSPLEKYVEENPEMPIDGETLLAQKKWEAEQQRKATEKKTADDRQLSAQRSLQGVRKSRSARKTRHRFDNSLRRHDRRARARGTTQWTSVSASPPVRREHERAASNEWPSLQRQ